MSTDLNSLVTDYEKKHVAGRNEFLIEKTDLIQLYKTERETIPVVDDFMFDWGAGMYYDIIRFQEAFLLDKSLDDLLKITDKFMATHHIRHEIGYFKPDENMDDLWVKLKKDRVFFGEFMMWIVNKRFDDQLERNNFDQFDWITTDKLEILRKPFVIKTDRVKLLKQWKTEHNKKLKLLKKPRSEGRNRRQELKKEIKILEKQVRELRKKKSAPRDEYANFLLNKVAVIKHISETLEEPKKEMIEHVEKIIYKQLVENKTKDAKETAEIMATNHVDFIIFGFVKRILEKYIVVWGKKTINSKFTKLDEFNLSYDKLIGKYTVIFTDGAGFVLTIDDSIVAGFMRTSIYGNLHDVRPHIRYNFKIPEAVPVLPLDDMPSVITDHWMNTVFVNSVFED